MKTFKNYLLTEKRKALKKKKANKKNVVKGIYGGTLFWNSYPMGGFAELDNNGESNE